MTIKYSLEDLIQINKKLMDEEEGCPWVKSQTYKTIQPYTIEEVYEVAEAIDREDLDDLSEELGDLLYQIVFYADMAEKKGDFTMDDITTKIAEKIIRRNPHIFDKPVKLSVDEVLKRWEDIKAAEKKKKPQKGTLEKVSKGLPALLQATKLCQKAAEKGFEHRKPEGFKNKYLEEFGELEQAIENHDQVNIEEEFGDVLLTLANWARHHGINPENALRKANNKFIKRFNEFEQVIDKNDLSIETMTTEEFLVHWQAVKKKTG